MTSRSSSWTTAPPRTTPREGAGLGAKVPSIVKAVHQENGGHGTAVMKGPENADGTYYKEVDSDDWVDADALKALLKQLRRFEELGTRAGPRHHQLRVRARGGRQAELVSYEALPKNKIFTWDEIGHFPSEQVPAHALAHATARTSCATAASPMPPHTFYVDNIYAYVPFPRCKTLYYLDVDLYRYFIGREDQSVNEKVLTSRIDHYWRVARIMMKSYHLYDDIKSAKLRSYMLSYFTIIMAICSVFSRLGPP